MFRPFTVRTNYSRDLKSSWPSASNFKSFSGSLEQFFLTVGQNNFGNKIPFITLTALATGMMAYPVVWTPVSDFMYVKNPFFEQDPLKLMVTGQFNKVPIMIGTVKDEGLLHTATLMQNPKVRIIYGGLHYFEVKL